MSKKMNVCKICKQEIAKSVKICPHCGAKHTAPIYKKWWFWTIIVVVIIGIAGNNSDEIDTQNEVTDNTLEIETVNTVDVETEYITEYSTEAVTEKTDQTTEIVETTSEPTENLTMGQINALGTAKTYLLFSAFSYEGLVEQLEFEKYSHDDAVYAADHCGADWNEQAAKSAKSYLEFGSFSYEGLIEQLEFEGFTNDQAVYGAKANGY